MPITEGKYQCKLCDDIFEARSGEFTKCKCGESEIKPKQFSYTYKNGNTVKEIEHKSYYLEEEFVKLPKDIQDIYDEIKQIKEANGHKYYLYEMTEKGKFGERFLYQINLSYNEFISQYSSEKNEVSLTISLEKTEYKGDERVKERLQRFLNLMKGIESGEINVGKRTEMIKLADTENLDYYEEPTGETNYTFYF